MIKTSVLVPKQYMADIAQRIAPSYEVELVSCKVTETADAVNEARAAAESGAQVIIARGYQAKIIRRFTDLTVVEIHFTAQEIGLLVKKACNITGKPHPYIHILAFENMLPDLSHMEELFDIRLGISVLEKGEEAGNIISGMENDRPDVIIGGEITCRAAQDQGYLTIFYQSTEESIGEAFRAAVNIGNALRLERLGAAQFETVLDTSFSGIIRINRAGEILSMNDFAGELLGISPSAVIGRELSDTLPPFDISAVGQILDGRRDSMSTSLNIKDEAWMLLMAPIEFDGNVTGAILSFRRSSGVRSTDSVRQNLIRSGYHTNVTFRDFKTDNPQMKEMLARAEEFALSENPILIYENTGTEANLLARAIHNNSLRKAGPFVSIDVRDIDPDWQMDAFFGRGREGEASSQGAALKAGHGTLFINRIEKLSIQLQHQILRIMMPWSYMHTDAGPIDSLDVRIIASAKNDLTPAVTNDSFSEELFYRLSGLQLTILSYNRRPEDVLRIFKEDISRYCRQYNRRMKVSDEGLKLLTRLNWQGGRTQIDAFSERLVLNAHRRQIDERVIQNAFKALYPSVLEKDGTERLVVYESPEGVKIRELLEKYHGNRSMVAKEMGVSTTTLWRYMKKYGVEANFRP